MRQISLDTETTGLDPASGHRVIEIGCVEMQDRILTGNSFHCYLNPGRPVDDGAVKVHGLTNEFLQDKPCFEDVVEEFLTFIKGAELIIHNAPFDVGFLNSEFKLTDPAIGTIAKYCKVLDTLTLARRRFPGQKNSLDALCKRFEVDNSHRQLHGALLDAQILAQVYLLMTGGQTALFAETDAQENSQAIHSVSTKIERNKTIPVIPADAKDLTAHEAFLQKLRDESGQCVWDEDTIKTT